MQPADPTSEFPPPRRQLTDQQRLALIILGSLAAAVLIVLLLVSALGGDPGTTSTSLFGSSSTSSTVLPSSTSSTTSSSTSTSSTSSTTTTAAPTTTEPATTTTAPDPFELLVLEPTGLDEVDFGARFDDVIEAMTDLLGQPTTDTGWTDASGSGCPGTEIRVVRWKSLELYFTNGQTDWGDEGERHFFTYIQQDVADLTSLPLATAEDIDLGSTVSELMAAYGGDLELGEDEIFGPVWLVDFPGAAVLSGSLTSVEPNGQVLSIQGGVGCGE